MTEQAEELRKVLMVLNKVLEDSRVEGEDRGVVTLHDQDWDLDELEDLRIVRGNGRYGNGAVNADEYITQLLKGEFIIMSIHMVPDGNKGFDTMVVLGK